MLKFAKKNFIQIQKIKTKELQKFIYKINLTAAGAVKTSKNSPSIWKYFFTWHSHYLGYGSSSRSRKSCALTGRSRSVYRMFRLSRIKTREYASAGIFLGVAKSSW